MSTQAIADINVTKDTKNSSADNGVVQIFTVKCIKDHIFKVTPGSLVSQCLQCSKVAEVTSDSKTHTNTIEHPVSSIKSIVGYISCSSKRQMFVYSSLQQQINDIKKYATQYGLPVAAIYQDESCDDLTLEGRTGFTKCLADIKHGQELVYRQPKNLVKNLFETLSVAENLKRRKISLKCLKIPGNMYHGDGAFLFKMTAMTVEHMSK